MPGDGKKLSGIRGVCECLGYETQGPSYATVVRAGEGEIDLKRAPIHVAHSEDALS